MKTPVVQLPALGQHPITLFASSSTQCDPAEHVAGSAESPPRYPQIVLSAWRRKSSRGERRRSGAAVGSGGHLTTFSSWGSIVLVWRGSRACPSANPPSTVESRRTAAAGGRRRNMLLLSREVGGVVGRAMARYNPEDIGREVSCWI